MCDICNTLSMQFVLEILKYMTTSTTGGRLISTGGRLISTGDRLISTGDRLN